MRFRSKPIEVEAIRWTGTNYEQVIAFAGVDGCHMDDGMLRVFDELLGYDRAVVTGEWIVRDGLGMRTVSPERFALRYETA